MRRFLLAAATALCATMGTAQTSPTTLLADTLDVQGAVLTATGNVTLWVNGQKITASSVRYDQSDDTLQIEGPIRLTDDIDTIILADQAELNNVLETAILRDARLILADRLQLAAAEISRPNDRYTGLFKVAMTSCYVCNNSTPIWQIRARQIVHDAEERQIYLDDVQLRVFDVPVFYFPQLRLPDPTLDRATGFMVPEVKSNSVTGLGLRVPYFIKIGDHRDLLLAPVISQDSTSLEFRYRQAYRTGTFTLRGAVSRDDIVDGEMRGYLFSNASFTLPRAYQLDLALRTTMDDNYLREYGFSGLDRLHSLAQISRTSDRGHASVRLSHYKSLRASEDNALLPSIVTEGSTERRYFPTSIGGEARYTFSFQSAHRYSDLDVDGFDVARLSADFEWLRNWTSDAGLVFDLGAQARSDYYIINQHSGFPDTVANSQIELQAGLSLPMQRVGDGLRDVVTPRLQFRLGAQETTDVPNQDSTRVDFDEGNLFAFQQTPGLDLSETGNAIALGLDWTRHLDTGARGRFSLGRIWWSEPQSQFSNTSGLAGSQSDWIISAGWSGTQGLDILGRMLLDDATGDIQKAEAHFDIVRPHYGIFATYTFINQDLDENRTIDISELALESRYKVNDHWTLSNNIRYDFGAADMTTAGFGVRFKNECVDVNFSASRRFESDPSVRASNDYGLTIELLGFGTGSGASAPKHTCGGRG